MDTKVESPRETMRGKLLQMMPKGAVCAEIGVWEGQFSRRILDECAPRQLHLIDPWAYLPEFSNTGFGKRKNADLMELKYRQVAEDFRHDPRVIIHRATSEEALAALPNGSLDWVYIDGNHNEPFVNRDLALSLQKVKPNGVIAGDDYNWMAEELGAPVRRAVTRLAEELGAAASLKVMANQYILRLSRG